MSSTSASARSRSRDRGYGYAFAAALVLSLTGILVRHVGTAHGVPPLVLTFWRSAFVVATLGPWLALRRPALLLAGRLAPGPLLALGVSLAAMNILWTFSVARIGAALGTVLIYSSGGFTAVLGALLLRERLRASTAAAIAFCLAGCVLVSGALLPGARGAVAQAGPDPLGVALGLLSGLAYAAYGLAGREVARSGVDPWSAVLHAFAVGGAITAAALLAVAATTGGEGARLLHLGADWAGWGDLLLLAAGPTVLGFGLYGKSLEALPASVANLVLTLEPPLTAVVAWLLLGERLTAQGWAGSALIVVGVGVLRLGELEPRGRSAPASPSAGAVAGLDGAPGQVEATESR